MKNIHLESQPSQAAFNTRWFIAPLLLVLTAVVVAVMLTVSGGGDAVAVSVVAKQVPPMLSPAPDIAPTTPTAGATTATTRNDIPEEQPPTF
jgi:hypothetical protein